MTGLKAPFKTFSILIIGFLILFTSCENKKSNTSSEESDKKPTNIDELKLALKKALTFYSSFDNGIDADFSLGDDRLFTSPIKSADSARLGLQKPDIKVVSENSLYGKSLLYTERSSGYIYYPSEKNIAYNDKDWSGAVSFWLSLDPETDLEPGYCDPIQITDVSYNDAAIWVDFTKENPRDFRLGVIGDREAWNPNPEGPDNENPIFIKQLPVVKEPPFEKGKWTHVLINYSHLNTENGTASLYMNGQLKGTRVDIKDPFNWDYPKSNIYLGLGYIGLMDELSIFNRSLSDKEITKLFQLENGVQSILN